MSGRARLARPGPIAGIRRALRPLGPPAALAVLTLAPVARAAHFPASGNDATCYACHTLDGAEAAAGTSHINRNARTFPQIAANDGLPRDQAPAYLGCTFCHFQGDNPAMRPVLGHFQGRLSSHPVGYDFSRRADTANEFLSGYGQTPGLEADPPASPTPNELDCVDCHDVDLGGGYPDHSARPAGNPFMLRAITGPGEYDGLCRGCHRSDAPVTVKGVALRLTSHADGAPGRPLVEDDGTVLRTGDLDRDGVPDAAGLVDQCRACHDAHYSAKHRLLNDGKERHLAGGAEIADTPITDADCTGTCHYPGDSARLPEGSYGTGGHGRAESTYRYKGGLPDAAGTPLAMAMPCTSCHAGLDLATKPHVEPVPRGADDRERYRNRFSLNVSLQAADVGSVFGNPIWGVCLQCHRTFVSHQTAGGVVGCQDCHDEHAEGTGDMPNVFMIPARSKPDGVFLPPGQGAHTRSRAGAEAVTYDSPRFDVESSPYAADTPGADFFREDGAGICDNAECHGGAGYAPVPAWLPSHSGGSELSPGDDCASCHPHNGDAAGGWRAIGYCDDCHAANGAGHAAAQGKSAGTHGRRHRTGTAYIASCNACHGNAGPGSPDHDDGTVDFGGTFMTEAFEYEKGGSFDDAECGSPANGCHAAESGAWVAGSLGPEACSKCHLAADKALGRAPTSGLHAAAALTRHDGSLQDGNCVNCHDAARPSTAHLDGSLNTAGTAAFGFHANVLRYGASGCRAAADCHGGGDAGTWLRRWVGVVDAAPGTAGGDAPGQPLCQNCHGDFSGWRWDEADATTTDHTDPYPGNAGDGMDEHDGCERCHGWGSAAYDMRWREGDHGNGSIDLNGPDATHGTAAGAGYDDSTGGCTAACHGSELVLRAASGWPAAYGDYGSGD